MYPKGTIYRASAGNTYGEYRVSLTEQEKKSFKRRRLFGALIASFAITSLIVFYGPTLMLDLSLLRNKLTSIQEQRITTKNSMSNVALASEPTPTPTATATPEAVTKVESFSLSIPAINAQSNVVYNVNPFEKTEYLNALQKGIAHASTSSLPGQGERVYLFAHSTNSPFNFTQYNAIFYKLRDLKNGDEIVSTLNGVEHKYVVKNKHIVDSDDVEWLTQKGNSEELVLQTCDPPGTTLRRLLVVAERV